MRRRQRKKERQQAQCGVASSTSTGRHPAERDFQFDISEALKTYSSDTTTHKSSSFQFDISEGLKTYVSDAVIHPSNSALYKTITKERFSCQTHEGESSLRTRQQMTEQSSENFLGMQSKKDEGNAKNALHSLIVEMDIADSAIVKQEPTDLRDIELESAPVPHESFDSPDAPVFDITPKSPPIKSEQTEEPAIKIESVNTCSKTFDSIDGGIQKTLFDGRVYESSPDCRNHGTSSEGRVHDSVLECADWKPDQKIKTEDEVDSIDVSRLDDFSFVEDCRNTSSSAKYDSGIDANQSITSSQEVDKKFVNVRTTEYTTTVNYDTYRKRILLKNKDLTPLKSLAKKKNLLNLSPGSSPTINYNATPLKTPGKQQYMSCRKNLSDSLYYSSPDQKDADILNESSSTIILSDYESTKRTDLVTPVKKFKADLSHKIDPQTNTLQDKCMLCLNAPKEASLIHGRSGHQICCYACAKKLRRRGKPCPVCRRKITKVIRNYIV